MTTAWNGTVNSSFTVNAGTPNVRYTVRSINANFTGVPTVRNINTTYTVTDGNLSWNGDITWTVS